MTIYKTPQIQTKSRQINKNMVQKMNNLMQKQGVQTRSSGISQAYDSSVEKNTNSNNKISDRDLYSSAIIDKKQKLENEQKERAAEHERKRLEKQ